MYVHVCANDTQIKGIINLAVGAFYSGQINDYREWSCFRGWIFVSVPKVSSLIFRGLE